MAKKKNFEEDLELMQDVVNAFRAIGINEIMNAYAIENVIFGDLKQGDKIPFDKFVKDLQLADWQPYTTRDYIAGIAITEDETVEDKEMDFFYKESFIFYMNRVFESAPYSKRKEDDEDGLRPFIQEGLIPTL